jgi:AcrR family transcriptional regulator
MSEPRRQRLRSDDRKRQLIGLTLDLIAAQGLQGATMARVAQAAGISETALYRHFRSRKELIQAALNETTAILERYFDISESDIKKRIHTVSANLYDGIMADSLESRLIFEFLRAPAKEDLQEPMQDRFQTMLITLEDLLAQGIANGQFRPDIDKTRIAWEIFAFGFTLHFVNLLGFEKHLTKKRALKSLDEILDKISV